MSDLIDLRYRRVSTFLADRGLDPDSLGTFMRDRVGPGELVLSSSPVHGLANASSDLDFLRVQREEIEGARISTKIFDQGHHLEVVSFSESEVQRNLAELQILARQSTADIVSGFRSWDARFEPRRKQTERLINGITLDGRAPFLSALPDLAVVWSRASLHTATEHLLYLSLAEASGETRGRIGYAYNLLLHLMDAMLSVHGDVYTTRKWYLLRWTRFVREGRWLSDDHAAAGSAIEKVRAALTPDAVGPLTAACAELVTEVARVTGASDGLAAGVSISAEATYTRFLEGSGMVTAGSTTFPVVGQWPPSSTLRPAADLADISAGEATTALRAIRAGAASASIRYEGADA